MAAGRIHGLWVAELLLAVGLRSLARRVVTFDVVIDGRVAGRRRVF